MAKDQTKKRKATIIGLDDPEDTEPAGTALIDALADVEVYRQKASQLEQKAGQLEQKASQLEQDATDAASELESARREVAAAHQRIAELREQLADRELLIADLMRSVTREAKSAPDSETVVQFPDRRAKVPEPVPAIDPPVPEPNPDAEPVPASTALVVIATSSQKKTAPKRRGRPPKSK